ncbi:uracil-DNA glycosylase family protein [Roseococcus sp. SDR]|uniref:uracil-DNA glycosylase family protein n=1 Tax=Roseococcus sp. SDR TaxID=2835532 RepID=UPI001BCD73A5|nr:uracil-DNA glycosylase family protein [Roseococcus sp. SDR]MBS7789141.1 uracil-DNA glycosylase family protein [Roseococcus sp. SDR]MBV1844455.1 uracil-DNA glycosylase family protein [Roseococcus sp. SDR]
MRQRLGEAASPPPAPADPLGRLVAEIGACRACAAHLPAGCRPVVRLGSDASILVIGQAPGTRVHASGTPWDDASGLRLRDWMGLPPEVFYDTARIAIMPMGFCYPGTGASGDLPPRPECAPLWHERALALLPRRRLTLLVGSYAQKRYLPGARRRSVTEMVRDHAAHGPGLFPLPHPSWRCNGWMRRNPWFGAEVLPALKARVAAALRAG